MNKYFNFIIKIYILMFMLSFNCARAHQDDAIQNAINLPNIPTELPFPDLNKLKDKIGHGAVDALIGSSGALNVAVSAGFGEEQIKNTINQINNGVTNFDKGQKISQHNLAKSFSADNEKHTLLDLASAGQDLQCVNYSPFTGICLWMDFIDTPPYIVFKISPIVEHYSPDAIVEVFRGKGNPASDEIDAPTSYSQLNHKIAHSVGNKLYKFLSTLLFHSSFDLNSGSKESGGYHSVHIMGNPMITLQNQIIGNLFNTVGYCMSDVTPFMTYYHSDLDPEWRLGLGETINAISPTLFKSDIKDGMNNWGNLYPRTGWTQSSSPVINAAIVSARAGDLVTSQNTGLHISKKLPDANIDGKVFFNGNVNDVEGKWKIIYPKDIHNNCESLPLKGMKSNLGIGTDEMKGASRKFVLQMWRKYRCCKKSGAVFLFKTQFKQGENSK